MDLNPDRPGCVRPVGVEMAIYRRKL